MRILVASDPFHPKIDGVADTAATVCKGLVARGHEVYAIAPAPGPRAEFGAKIARIPAVPMPLYPELRVAWRLDRIRRAVRQARPDACIVLSPGPIGSGVVHFLPNSVPILNIYTTDIPAYLRSYGIGVLGAPAEALLRWMARRSVATLCPTRTVLDELSGRGYPRLALWGRGVDGELFHPRKRDDLMRWRLTGGESHKPLVLYVGRLAREKQLDILFEAARQLPGYRFALVGDGPQRDELERRFAAVPSVFTGYLRGEELASAFAAADVFAFPSDTDTFGQVVIQAMASGVPPVVVRGSAPAELVEDGLSGRHVGGRNPAELALAIRDICEEPAALEALRAGARSRSARFSWDALVAQLEPLLGGNAETRNQGADDAA